MCNYNNYTGSYTQVTRTYDYNLTQTSSIVILLLLLNLIIIIIMIMTNNNINKFELNYIKSSLFNFIQ